MKLEKNNIIISLFGIICGLTINYTQNSYNLSELANNGYSDGIFYLKLLSFRFNDDFPLENIPFHHFQRLIYPAIIGYASSILNVEPVFLYKAVSNIALLFILINTGIICRNFNGKFYTCLLAIIFASFTLQYRMMIQGWVLLPDILFILSIQIFCKNIYLGKNPTMSVIIASFARQTSILLIPTLIFLYAKRRNLYYLKSIIFVLLINILTYTISKIYIKNDAELFDNISGIVRGDAGLKSYVIMLMAMMYSYLLLFILIDYKKHLILLLLLVSICSQPLLGGPEVVGYNNGYRTSGYLYIPMIPIILSQYKIKLRFFLILAILSTINIFDYKYNNIFNFEKTYYFIFSGVVMIISGILIRLKNEKFDNISRPLAG